jgi:hypothetical protein
MTSETHPSEPHRGSFLIDEWCLYRRVSRAMLYRMWQRGTGPRRTFIGRKATITVESDAEWVAANTEPAAAPSSWMPAG